MLTRQTLWKPVTTCMPDFMRNFDVFAQKSPHSKLMTDTINYKAGDTMVLTKPDAKGHKRVFAMAFPFTVTSSVCGMEGPGAHVMPVGALTSLVDTTTSLHVMLGLLPSLHTHVSISIQANCLHPIFVGTKVVLISRMDKLGKRIAYTSAELLRDSIDDVFLSDEALAREEGSAATVEALERLLRRYTVLANGKHVKCILPLK